MLFALGLEQPLKTVWALPAGKEVRLWNTGQSWKLFDLGATSVERYGYPYFMIHRADLHATLVQAVRALKPDAIHLDKAVTGLEQAGTTATLKFADGGSATGDAVVGADGVHSALRSALFGAVDHEIGVTVRLPLFHDPPRRPARHPGAVCAGAEAGRHPPGQGRDRLGAGRDHRDPEIR